MGSYPDLWRRYFANFFQYKLQLGSDGGISQKILKAFFEALDKQEPMARVISLHCYSHTYHLNLAKIANILRQLDQIHQVSVCLGSKVKKEETLNETVFLQIVLEQFHQTHQIQEPVVAAQK